MCGPRIRALLSSDLVGEFNCGDPDQNGFLLRAVNDGRGYSRTYVLLRGRFQCCLPHILGFYSLSNYSLGSSKLPTKLRETLPQYAMPLTLIGQLGVDLHAQGRGYSSLLIRDAIARARRASLEVASYGMAVHAKADKIELYKRLGFFEVGNMRDPQAMLLPFELVDRAIQGRRPKEQ